MPDGPAPPIVILAALKIVELSMAWKYWWSGFLTAPYSKVLSLIPAGLGSRVLLLELSLLSQWYVKYLTSKDLGLKIPSGLMISLT